MAEDLSLESSTVATSIEAIRGELSHTKLATSTLNLLVWIDDPARRDWIRERTGMLSRKHPSFTLVFDHTGERDRDATVTTGRRDTATSVSVDEERVEIDVSGMSGQDVAGYVTALCTTGVPTVLWWSGFQESSRAIFAALLPLIDTLVVDSSGGTRDATGLGALASFHAEHPEVALRDLAWLRLRPWQDMIANFFDDPALAEELFTIRKLFVASGSESEALYLAGWLASRLGWRATGKDTFADRDGDNVAFQRRRTGEIRRVQSICLDSDTSWYHGEVAGDAENVVRVWVEGEHAREPRLVPLQAIDNASLLERAILERGLDELFETALRSAATLLG
ncbi:MAG TPA: glucose-6-phosphate dehydrogenase assembly protein OpcA [Candidatus Elarobacter sp.]|jgi:glucose-6-phosphate dehydrogenase assembly protein OpcA|nr:glucose-6-phosphate dehydrogenase assembly protein OpcA [Candidatus Elarobacter sp.]